MIRNTSPTVPERDLTVTSVTTKVVGIGGVEWDMTSEPVLSTGAGPHSRPARVEASLRDTVVPGQVE